MSIAIAFVLRPGHTLEREAILLAASIRQFVKVDVAIYAFVEAIDRWRLPRRLKSILDRLGIVVRHLPPGYAFRPIYPHGNKIVLCAQEFTEDRVVFLDSDMLFVTDTDLTAITGDDLVLCRNFGPDWGKAEDWQKVYRHWDVDIADVPTMQNDWGRTVPQYFNAGLVSFSTATDFGGVWLSAAQKIDADDQIPEKRPWLDQLALPVVPFAGGPMISLPRDGGFNMRPTRENLGDLVLAHYTPTHLYLSGASNIADAVLHDQLGLSLRQLEDAQISEGAKSISKRIGRNKRPFVKIYGERNTGTNLLSRVLADNYATDQLHSTHDVDVANVSIAHALGPHRQITTPAVTDLADSIILSHGLGWKHGAPPFSTIARSPCCGNTLFVCIYKDPYFWLKSTFKRPYNPASVFPEHKDFTDFMTQPFGISARDRVDLPYYSTPLEVYQDKLRSYLRLKEIYGDDVLLIPYEGILRNQDQFFRHLSAKLQCTQVHPELPTTAAKEQDIGKIDLAGYTEKYHPDNRTHGLTDEQTKSIAAQIDQDLWDALEAQNIFQSEIGDGLAHQYDQIKVVLREKVKKFLKRV